MRSARKDVIFGSRAILEAIDNGKEIDKVLLRSGQSNELTSQLLGLLKHNQIPFQYVPVEKLDRITEKNHQGCIAFISPVIYQNIEEIVTRCFEEGRDPFLLILDEISDVRNFGAISRSAECFGIDAIIVPMKGSAQINADSVKTSAGALMKIPVCRVMSLLKTIEYLQNCGIKVVAVTEKSNTNVQQLVYEGPIALVMGSEEYGISEACMRRADELVRIPMLGTIESLNVSVSAGIIMYEVVRSRTMN